LIDGTEKKRIAIGCNTCFRASEKLVPRRALFEHLENTFCRFSFISFDIPSRAKHMKNLFEPSAFDEVKARIGLLRADTTPLWGTMNPAQAMAHCCGSLELALGDMVPPRHFLGRIAGLLIKPMVLGNDKPIRRNSPTIKGLAVQNKRHLGIERERLYGLIDRFVTAGPSGCTKHPHTYFGRLTSEEWAVLMYKHLDHHLRQFQV
jgi:hypothetical protein